MPRGLPPVSRARSCYPARFTFHPQGCMSPQETSKGRPYPLSFKVALHPASDQSPQLLESTMSRGPGRRPSQTSVPSPALLVADSMFAGAQCSTPIRSRHLVAPR